MVKVGSRRPPDIRQKHERLDKPIRIVADDHPLLREGIAALIGAESDMQLVAEAATGREALAQFKLKRPDVTLMDLQMPDIGGIEAIIAIRGEFPNARIIVLTTYAGDVQVLRALKAGARGLPVEGTRKHGTAGRHSCRA